MGIRPVCWMPPASAPSIRRTAGALGLNKERAPPFGQGVVPAAIALESHPIDSRIKIADDGTVQTLTSRMGTGGMNVPLVLKKIRPGARAAAKGRSSRKTARHALLQQ